MSDTWGDIQATKNKHSNLRERMLKRKREQEKLLGDQQSSQTTTNLQVKEIPVKSDSVVKSSTLSSEDLDKIERIIVQALTDVNIEFPLSLNIIVKEINKNVQNEYSYPVIKELIKKLAAQKLVTIEDSESNDIQFEKENVVILSVDFVKISAVYEEESIKRKRDDSSAVEDDDEFEKRSKIPKLESSSDLESLLSTHTAKQRENIKTREELHELLAAPTAIEQINQEKFQSKGEHLKKFCVYGTKNECYKNNRNLPCKKLHFKKLIHKHTDTSLGDCSFLNTCFHMETCKYVHYTIEYPEELNRKVTIQSTVKSDLTNSTKLFAPQWVQCDIRSLDMKVLGKFAVIMADPPWDIHMELPYGTMSDDEMRSLAVPSLQDDGYIFLWVTGRAMELGRDCLKVWGYERCDELIWVKTNQLQRIIRTGRTGHWLNHGKEHCLVGVKGNPKNFNKGLDCDVIVAEVRETSHKPDEIYGIIERLAPSMRKIELFGRMHNVQPNWITIGNQLDGVKLLEPESVKRFKQRYPDGNAMKPPTGLELTD